MEPSNPRKLTPDRAQRRAQELVSRLSHARATLKQEQAAQVTAQQALKDSEHALEIVQKLARQLTRVRIGMIAGLVSRCLAAVFDEPYQFVIKFDSSKNGRTEASFAFMREGYEVDPLTGAGGGMVDVASFALRLSAVMLSQPPVRRLLVLDEPFRCVSRRYLPALGTLLQTLSRELEIQIIVVTHSPEITEGAELLQL